MSEYINNKSKRKEQLKDVIRQLHEGKSVDELKAQFGKLLHDVGATEIAELEQELVDEGLPETEIKRLCDVHVAVFRESLDTKPQPESTPGHPVHTFRRENEAAGKVLEALRAAIVDSQWDAARQHLCELQEYDRHYVRKEDILFPYLEKHGFRAPTSVMWAIHDDIRKNWKELGELLLEKPDDDRVGHLLKRLDQAIRDMFYKEENILFPNALHMLTPDEWQAIRAQESEVGYFQVQPVEMPVETKAAPPAAPAAVPLATAGEIPLQTGALTAQQINWMLTNLPVDVTYVDADDTVRFYSETPERIFRRTPAIIGRKVLKCHPPDSVHRVQRIVDDFRAGTRDTAEFWIQMMGKFIHIRYFAVRDEQGQYQGTIEVSQDVTAIRALEGERRLLDEGE
jgi:DUF438 domain-containing protein